MRKFTLLTLLLVICATIASAQSNYIKGTITDTFNKQNLHNSAIALLQEKDSVLIKFTRSDKSGNFELKDLPKGKFVLMVTYPSYADYMYPIVIKDSSAEEIGLIKMTLKSKLLEEVLVRQKVAAIRIKGDTVEFKADSFKVRAGASVEEMLRKLPGLQVDKDGNISAQGEKVEKVLVDGEEFFGDDPTVATKNLQADAIDKVQVFDKKSDQAAFTGIDDGSKTKTLNLTLKEDKKKGYFGKVELASDMKDRWNNNAMINRFKSKQKFSVYGIMSSTGKTGLSWEENSKYGENNNMEYNEDGGFFFSYGGGDEFDNYGSFGGQGLPTSWAGGLQYSHKFDNDKQNFNGSYRYNKLNTIGGGRTISQSILPGNAYYSQENRDVFSTKDRHSYSGVYDYAIDSFTSLKIKANGNTGNQKTFTNYDIEKVDQFGNLVEGLTNTSSDGTNGALNSNFFLRRRFKKAGRTMSVNFDQQSKTTNNTGFLYSVNKFFDSTKLRKIDTVDQKKINEIRNEGYYTRVSYTEPVIKNVFVELSYGLRFSNSESKKLSYDQSADGKYETLNAPFSNHYKFKVITNSGGMVWRYNSKKITASAGGDVAFADFNQTDVIRNTPFKYSFTNFFPKANYTYKFNPNSRFSFSYNGSTRQPTIEQIQPVRDNINTLNIAIGNPDLKQEFRHSYNINYNSYKVLKQRGFYTYAGFNTTANSISTNETTIISGDSAGVRRYQFINLDGNYNGYSGGGFHFKLIKLDVGINTGFNINVNRNNNIISTINGTERKSFRNTSDNNSYGLNFGFYKYKDKKYDFGYRGEVKYNTASSTVNKELTNNYYSQEHNFNFTVSLPLRFEINSSIEANLRQKTKLFTENNNVFFWNAYVGKKMFKNDKGLLSLRVNDILDQNKGYSRNLNNNIVNENTYQTLRRYFLLSFTINFSKNPGGAASSNP